MSTKEVTETSDGLMATDEIIWNELVSRNVAGLKFSPAEVSVKFAESEYSVYVKGIKLDPKNSILLVRSTKDFKEQVYSIATIFKDLGGLVSDPLQALVYPAGKLLPYISRIGKINIVPSYFFNPNFITSEEVMKTLTYPIILKPQNGFRGKNVTLINSDQEFATYISGLEGVNLMAQPYLSDIVGEYRVVVVGGKSLGAIKKTRTYSEENQFAAELDVDTKVEDQEVSDFAEKASLIDGLDICGADVVRVESGELYLIENNRCPDLATFTNLTKIDVGKAIVDFLLEK
jgi:glutathione synthase/RimK-type ligase-like ATP-grasp enzyme